MISGWAGLKQSLNVRKKFHIVRKGWADSSFSMLYQFSEYLALNDVILSSISLTGVTTF